MLHHTRACRTRQANTDRHRRARTGRGERRARLPQCVYCQRKDDIAIAERGLPPTTTQAAPPSHLPMHIATPRALRGLASGMCRLRLVLGMCAVPTSLFGQDPHLGCRCVPRPFGSAARALPPCQPSHKTRQRLRHHDARRGRLATCGRDQSRRQNRRAHLMRCVLCTLGSPQI